MPCLHARLGLNQHNAKCFIVGRGGGNPKEDKNIEDNCVEVDWDIKDMFSQELEETFALQCLFSNLWMCVCVWVCWNSFWLVINVGDYWSETPPILFPQSDAHGGLIWTLLFQHEWRCVWAGLLTWMETNKKKNPAFVALSSSFKVWTTPEKHPSSPSMAVEPENLWWAFTSSLLATL